MLGWGCCYPEEVFRGAIGTISFSCQLLASQQVPRSSGAVPTPSSPHSPVPRGYIGLFIESPEGSAVDGGDTLGYCVSSPVQVTTKTLGAAEANLEMVSVCLHTQEHTNWAHLGDMTGIAGITTCACCS